MKSRARRRCALTIAGSDSGGGAGLQADLKTYASVGVHGTSVVTSITAQNPDGVSGVHPVPGAMVTLQLRAVTEGFPIAVAKTGMLYSAGIIDRVASWAKGLRGTPLVVDPVMIATSGARLLRADAVRALRERLLPLASIATPNADEATALTDASIRDREDLRAAARIFHDRYGCAVLVKGGHVPGPEAVDVLWDGRNEWVLGAPRVRGVSSHGTGCTYAAAIAGYLALGLALPDAVRMAKGFITRAIECSVRVGRHAVLESFWT